MAINRWSGSPHDNRLARVSVHSLKVARRFASSRLSGMVLMAMELLASHDKFVTELSSHHKQNDLFAFDIIQVAKVADSQLKFGKRVGTQLLYSFRPCSRLMEETCLDCRFENTLLPDR